jgi:EmrB/QacA subfamily drug resistance transporter
MDNSAAVIDPEEKKRIRWIVFSVAFAVFMVRLDGYIVNISLPTLARNFHVGTSEASWVILSYLLVVTGSTLIFGKLADRIGLKKIFVWGYGFFALGSLLCGLSPTIYLLDSARCLQGVGGAMMITSGMASIPHYLPKNIAGWAFGICSLANSLGIMVGAPLGGVITGFISWRWIFLINVPVGLLAIMIAKRSLPADQTRPPLLLVEDRPFDVFGSVLSFIGLAALVFALSRGDAEGWQSGLILTAFAVAGSSLLAFYLRERTVSDPILNLKIFRNRDFSFAVLTTLVALMLLSGGNFLIPFYLELIKGLRPEHVGAVVMIYSVVNMPIGPFAGRLSDRINPRRLCTVAMLLAFISCLVFALTLSMTGLFPVILYLVLLAISYALFFPANNHLVMSLAPEESQGTASAIYTNTMNVGMVLGVCLFEGAFSQALPTGLSTMSLTPEAIRPYLSSVSGAFQFAFIVGAFFSLLAFFLSFYSGRHASTAGGNG